MKLMRFTLQLLALTVICSTVSSCVSRARKSSTRKDPKKIAAVTRLKSNQDLSNLAKAKGSQLPFCYIDQNRKIFFINARKYDNPTEFLNKYIDEYKVFSSEDMEEFSRHPLLKEAFCGHVHFKQSKNRKKLYFNLEREEESSTRKVATIYKALRKRISISNSDGKLSYFYRDPQLHSQYHRNFKAMGIPISHVSSISKSLKKTERKQEEAKITSLKLTQIDSVIDNIQRSDNPVLSKAYGHLSPNLESDLKKTFIPFALHDYFLRSKIKKSNCEEARNQCTEAFGNSCQYAHGICLSTLIKYKNARTLDFMRQLFTRERKKSYATNQSLKNGTLGFLRELQKLVELDKNFLSKLKQHILEHYPDNQLLRIRPSYNIETSKVYNLPLSFMGEYACLNDQVGESGGEEKEFSACFDASSRTTLAQMLENISDSLSAEDQSDLYKLSRGIFPLADSIKKIFLSLYTPEVYDLFQEKGLLLENLRSALVIQTVAINVSHHGYAFIYPSSKERAFKIKIVDFPFHPWKKDYLEDDSKHNELYLTITTDNRIHSVTQRLGSTELKDFSSQELETLVMGVKKKYLEKLKSQKNSENRLYSFKYALTHDETLEIRHD